MPSRNSFLLNTHWVAALNFHATTRMLTLAGSSMRSSQNCWIPSIPILFSSWGSAGKRTGCSQWENQPVLVFTRLVSTHLCICCRAVPASCDPLRFSWILYSRGLGSESSYLSRLLVSSHSVSGSTRPSSPQPAWRTWTAESCLSAMTSVCATRWAGTQVNVRRLAGFCIAVDCSAVKSRIC